MVSPLPLLPVRSSLDVIVEKSRRIQRLASLSTVLMRSAAPQKMKKAMMVILVKMKVVTADLGVYLDALVD
jgi:hypothetical protein